MLKKFVSSLLAVLLIAGCSAGTDGEMVLNHKPVAEMADGLVQTLGMSELKEVKERVMYGMFFETRKDAEDNFVTDGRVYRGEDKNADTVGVFETTDKDQCIEYLNRYLETQKANSQMYSQEEVFKIDNAILETSKDGSVVVLVISSEIEKAQTAVNELLK
jgi:hypothetical protein